MSPISGTAMDQHNLQAWIVQYLADELALEAGEIDVHLDFSGFGLDSVAAIGMIGALEEAIGREIEASAFLDHPSIARLAAFLARP